MDNEEAVEVSIEMEIGEEKVPTVAEARARFDQVEGVPSMKVSRVQIQPKGPPAVPLAAKLAPEVKTHVPTPVPEAVLKTAVAPAKKKPPLKVAKPDTAAQTGIKSPSPRLLLICNSIDFMIKQGKEMIAFV